VVYCLSVGVSTVLWPASTRKVALVLRSYLPPVLKYCKSHRRLRNTWTEYVILHLFHLKQWKQGLEHLRKYMSIFQREGTRETISFRVDADLKEAFRDEIDESMSEHIQGYMARYVESSDESIDLSAFFTAIVDR
jgi:hypothetical protein